jgi:hypothetical protein
MSALILCGWVLIRQFSHHLGLRAKWSRTMAATLPELVRSGTSASPAFLEKKPGVKRSCLGLQVLLCRGFREASLKHIKGRCPRNLESVPKPRGITKMKILVTNIPVLRQSPHPCRSVFTAHVLIELGGLPCCYQRRRRIYCG